MKQIWLKNRFQSYFGRWLEKKIDLRRCLDYLLENRSSLNATNQNLGKPKNSSQSVMAGLIGRRVGLNYFSNSLFYYEIPKKKQGNVYVQRQTFWSKCSRLFSFITKWFEMVWYLVNNEWPDKNLNRTNYDLRFSLSTGCTMFNLIFFRVCCKDFMSVVFEFRWQQMSKKNHFFYKS